MGSKLKGHFSKKYGLWGTFFRLQDPMINFCWIQKKSYPPYNIHRERWCIPKNPNVTHLGKEHFFGTPCRGIFMEDQIPQARLKVCLPGSRLLSGLQKILLLFFCSGKMKRLLVESKSIIFYFCQNPIFWSVVFLLFLTKNS